MKKLFSLLLAAMLLLGCTAVAETVVDYTGTWIVTGAEAEGVQMGASMLSAFGMDISMTLNADGTARLVAAGEAEDGAWVVNETGVAVTDASGMTMNAVYRDEMLVIEQDSMAMMLTREGAAPAVVEEAAATVLANVDPAAFEGQWLLTSASMMGMDFPAEALGLYMAMMLSEGSGIFSTSEDGGEPISVGVTYVVYESEGVGTAMDINVLDAETGVETVMMTLNMQSDGSLVYNLNMEGMVISYVFTAVAK